MPVGVVKPNFKLSPKFDYPPSGKVKLYVEASSLVDIFISLPEQAGQITSVAEAAKLVPPVLIRNARWQLDEIITFPPAWIGIGWALTIGHPGGHDEPIGVFFTVTEA